MPTDPYATPRAVSADEHRAAGPVKAVLVGSGIVIGGSVLLGIGVAAYGFALARSGMSAEQIAAVFEQPSSAVSIAGYLAGCAVTVIAGFVCTRMARRNDYTLGMILGVISWMLGLTAAFTQTPLTEVVAMSSLNFVCVVLGAGFGRVKP